MKKIICFYHANCVDGAASAAIIKRKYPDASCVPMNHGNPITISLKDKTVFIVDFSFDAETLKQIKKDAKEVYWYDHHITALPIQKAIGWGIVDLSESGASLTWKMENPNEDISQIIEYVKDKDLWQWKLPNSRAISMALSELEEIHNPESKTWKDLIDHLSNEEFQKLLSKGEHSLQVLQTRIQRGVKNAFELNFEGHRALAVNWSQESSDMGEYIYKNLGYEVAILFHFTGDYWSFSLRSNKVDVSSIASKFGGGGHPGAAGFRKDSIDWLLKAKVKKINNIK